MPALTNTLTAGSLALVLALTGCTATGPTPTAAGPSASASPAVPPPGTSPSASSPSATGATDTPRASSARQVEGSVVRFTARGVSVDVVIGADNATTRDFLSMLPLTLTLEEFSGREKIGYLPRKLDTEESPGSDPEDGDLIYFAPWGNIGFYCNTAGVGHSDQVIHLGAYQTTLEQLTKLEGGDVTVTLAR